MRKRKSGSRKLSYETLDRRVRHGDDRMRLWIVGSEPDNDKDVVDRPVRHGDDNLRMNKQYPFYTAAQGLIDFPALT